MPTSSNVMVANDANDIIYLNRSAVQLMTSAQADFRQTLPTFDPAKLLGASTRCFPQELMHQDTPLSSLTKASTSESKFGSLTMKITASPIFDEAGKRLGTVVEWTDRTQELAVEGEVQNIVTEAIGGNLDRRIALEGKAGFFRSLSSGHQ